MTTYGGPCEFCGRAVNPDFAAYPITGWEVIRAGGGANRILGRERVPGRIAHIACAEREVALRRQGIAPGQEALL